MKDLPVAGGRKTREVYLVQPPYWGGPGDVQPPLGLLSLAAVLEADGGERNVHVVDQNLLTKIGKIDRERSLRTQLVRTLPRESSAIDLVGVTTWSYNFDVTMEFVEEVRKKHRDVPIVLGGPHVTFVDQEVLETFPSVDFVIRDEGEITFPRLVRAIERGGKPAELETIPGLTWRRDGQVIRNPSGDVIEDLDALPFPAFHLIDPRDYARQNPVLTLEAGRGCPYNCNFCSTTNMFQRKYRVKTAARLVDEIEWAMKTCGSNRFELLHDNLVAGKKYVLSLCAEIRARNIDVSWSCTSRTDNITEEVAHHMFLAGCDQVFFGVESLSEERQAWTGKKLKPPKVHAAVELTARQHITPTAGIIVGFPDETQEEFDTTVEAAMPWTTDPGIKAHVSTAVLRYYPGADLFQNKDALRYDVFAGAFNCPFPGYRLRKTWRDKTSLFPLQSIHTAREETRRNLTRAQLIRTLLTMAPLTFRACKEVLGIKPRDLLDRMSAGRDFEFLRKPNDMDLKTNETLRALGDVVAASDSEIVRELLSWEVPFWESDAVAPPLNELQHVSHPKRFVQDDLLEAAIGRLAGSPRRERPGLFILALRAGREHFACVTDDVNGVVTTFKKRLLHARRG